MELKDKDFDEVDRLSNELTDRITKLIDAFQSEIGSQSNYMHWVLESTFTNLELTLFSILHDIGYSKEVLSKIGSEHAGIIQNYIANLKDTESGPISN